MKLLGDPRKCDQLYFWITSKVVEIEPSYWMEKKQNFTIIFLISIIWIFDHWSLHNALISKRGQNATKSAFFKLFFGTYYLKIYTYKTWILSVCLSVCSRFSQPPKVPALWNFGSRRHLGLVGTWRTPIFEILIFTDSRGIFPVFSNGFFMVFFSKISAILTPMSIKFGHKNCFYTKKTFNF